MTDSLFYYPGRKISKRWENSVVENKDKVTHLRIKFDVCSVQSPFGLVHMPHQNLSACALFCINSLAKVKRSYYSIIISHGILYKLYSHIIC